jgi:hypothetical protein
MGEKETEQEKLLRELTEQVHHLNEKIDKIESRISHGVTLKQTKKDLIKKRVEQSSAFAYAIGGLGVAMGIALLSLYQNIGYALLLIGRSDVFIDYVLGSGMVMISGGLMISCGYTQGRYAGEGNFIKKVSFLGYKDEIVFNWKRDIPIIICSILCLCGMALLVFVAFVYMNP